MGEAERLAIGVDVLLWFGVPVTEPTPILAKAAWAWSALLCEG